MPSLAMVFVKQSVIDVYIAACPGRGLGMFCTRDLTTSKGLETALATSDANMVEQNIRASPSLFGKICVGLCVYGWDACECARVRLHAQYIIHVSRYRHLVRPQACRGTTSRHVVIPSRPHVIITCLAITSSCHHHTYCVGLGATPDALVLDRKLD